MEKSNPFLIAMMAFIAFFIVFIILKYLLNNGQVDIQSALAGAVLFCIGVFLVHQLMTKRAAQ
jgi:uncharacterized membrane protein YjjP (DUF1212 family)